MKERYPITLEEIAQVREEIQIGQAIDIEQPDPEERWGTIRYRARVIEKYRHFVLCEYRKKGKRLRETITYIQIILGDGVWLV